MRKPAIGFQAVSIKYDTTNSIRMLKAMGSPKKARWNGLPARPPKKGELFLSGAIVEAYVAVNDMVTPYYLAEVVQ